MSDSIAAPSTETSQAEGEGPEGSDKPPHSAISKKKDAPSRDKRITNGAHHAPSSPESVKTARAGRTHESTSWGSVPLPPPDSHSFPKAPGPTRRDLQQLELSKVDQQLALVNGASHTKQDTSSSSTTGSITPSSSDSPSASESESWSLPSTQPPSRAPSFSAGKSGGKLIAEKVELMHSGSSSTKMPTKKEKGSSRTPSFSKLSPTHSNDGTSRKGPPSIHSDGGGQKFTLKDLLGAPKLVRRSSARSTSSKKSDSDRGGRSEAGGSTASLLKKYGVCEKVAIGKGATSVVRLAHKWDRSEEKLYAVKVCIFIFYKWRKSLIADAFRFVDVGVQKTTEK